MVLAGHVDDYPLAELLFFLSSKQRTGQLVLKRADMKIIFMLRHGRLIAAQMLPADQRLGERLIAEGVVSPDVLSEALQIQQRHERDRPLGTLMVESGFIERDVVIRTLRGQIADCLVAFLIAPGGTFTFRHTQIDPTRIDVEVIVEREVLDAMRRADEHVARQIDTGPLRFKSDLDAGVFQPFIVENWDLIDAMIGGAETIDEIVAETAWDRERVVTSLFQLQANGAIDLVSSEVALANAIVRVPA